MAGVIAKVYAKALFDLADSVQSLETVLKETHIFFHVWEENKNLGILLESARFSRMEKQDFVKEVFDGIFGNEMMGLFQVVIEKGRQRELYSILRAFEELVSVHQNQGKAYVTSAVKLSRNLKKRVEEVILEHTQLKVCEVEYSIDSRLIGGMVIRVGDQVIDACMRTQFEELKRRCVAQ